MNWPTTVFLLASIVPLIAGAAALWFGPERRKSFRDPREQ